MGITRQHGYSAFVAGFFETSTSRIPLAKINGATLVLAEPCDALPPGISGDLVIVVDGREDRRSITLPNGSTGEFAASVPFKADVPF